LKKKGKRKRVGAGGGRRLLATMRCKKREELGCRTPTKMLRFMGMIAWREKIGRGHRESEGKGGGRSNSRKKRGTAFARGFLFWVPTKENGQQKKKKKQKKGKRQANEGVTTKCEQGSEKEQDAQSNRPSYLHGRYQGGSNQGKKGVVARERRMRGGNNLNTGDAL